MTQASADNTLVLFTGDNGTDEPIVSMMNGRKVAGAKGKTTDGGTRVPLIAQWPGRTPEGLVSGDLVDFSDFLPTMCEAAGVNVPASPSIDGRSFLPQLLGERGNPRDWIYVWYARNGGPTGQEFTRDQRYKLYRSGEFFDIENDVLEKQPLDVASLSDDARAVRSRLQTALDQYANARPARFANWKANQQTKKKNKKKRTK